MTAQSQKHKNISIHSNKEFEIEFSKLWLKLESIYVNQKFNNTMGNVNSATARSWRVEFKRNGISESGLIEIRNNLTQLKNPEFIPNSLTLIALLKDNNECRPRLGQEIDPETLPTEKEILAKRESTRPIKNECMKLISEILHRKYKEKKPENKILINKLCPGPSNKMVRLIHNHNKLLISLGKEAINMPNCKKRAHEMGLY